VNRKFRHRVAGAEQVLTLCTHLVYVKERDTSSYYAISNNSAVFIKVYCYSLQTPGPPPDTVTWYASCPPVLPTFAERCSCCTVCRQSVTRNNTFASSLAIDESELDRVGFPFYWDVTPQHRPIGAWRFETSSREYSINEHVTAAHCSVTELSLMAYWNSKGNGLTESPTGCTPEDSRPNFGKGKELNYCQIGLDRLRNSSRFLGTRWPFGLG